MIDLLFKSPTAFFIALGSLILAISIHEFAHAFIADRLGDPTPRINGRLTLNPKAHLDKIGTITLILFGFGWGKPVMIDVYNLRNPKRDNALISLAGPLSNIILTILAMLAMKLAPALSPFLITFYYYNIALAVFNLVPVYPLDGQKILTGILPHDLAIEYDNIMRQYGSIILILLIWPFSGESMITRIIMPVVDKITMILTSIIW